MGGLEATRRIRADPHLSEIPVVAISAYAMKEEVDAAMEAGCTDYLAKPIDSNRLAAILASQIDREGPR